MKKLIILILLGLLGCAHYSNTDTTEHYTPEAPLSAAPSDSFKKYPDQVFDVKAYISGMVRGEHNLLIWKDPSVNLSQYSAVKVTDFGGRLLPHQNVFSCDPYIALFNWTFRSTFKQSQADAPNVLLIEGAVVECNPGSRALRFWIGFGAGKAACAVVCEVYEPGKANPCIPIYTRDTASLGITSGTGAGTGGDSVLMLNKIMTVLAMRLATILNTTIPIKLSPITPLVATQKIVTVTWTFVNIRSGAGNEFPIIATVKQGDKLTVIGEQREWFNVRLEDGKEGWISNGVVK